jgi:hypothetical protein
VLITIFFAPLLHFLAPDLTTTLDPFLLVQIVTVAALALAAKFALSATQATAEMTINPGFLFRQRRTKKRVLSGFLAAPGAIRRHTSNTGE